MSWIAVAGAAVTVIGGAMSDRSAKKGAAKDREEKRFLTQEESRLNREEMIFERELDEHYKQRERASRQRGLDEFRKFNTLQQFAPEYQDTGQRVVVPNAPQVSTQQGTNITPTVSAPAPTPVIPQGNTNGS